MPKGKTDIKRFQKQEKRRQRNRSVRSAVKTYVGKARQSIVGATSREDESLQGTLSAPSASWTAPRGRGSSTPTTPPGARAA